LKARASDSACFLPGDVCLDLILSQEDKTDVAQPGDFALNVNRLLKSTCVLPSFFNLFERRARFADLEPILQRYPLQEWLSFLSRLQVILSGKRSGEDEYLRKAFFGVLSQDLRDRIVQFSEKHQLGSRIRLFYERQLSTLQQLVIMYAPLESGGTFDAETGRHDLGLALLMTIDLMDHDRRQNDRHDEVLACLIQDQIRMATTPPSHYAGRALHFYEIQAERRSSIVEEYLGLFEQATGVSAVDYMLGGFRDLIWEENRDPEEIAAGWAPIGLGHSYENEQERQIVAASVAVRQQKLDDVRQWIRRLEGSRPVRDWNLIALYKYPLIDLDPQPVFLVNLTALGRSLFDGVRHAILTAACEGRLAAPYNSAQAVGGLYGRVFERYVLQVLERAFGPQLIRIPEGDNERCDALIWLPDKIVLVEIKGERHIAKDHARYMSLDQRHDELCKIGIPKAVRQICRTISDVRAGTLRLPDLPCYDWTVTPIVPLVVTEELTPQLPGIWDRLYASFNQPLQGSRGAGPVGRLRLLSVDDIEMVPDLAGPENFATVLFQWGLDAEFCEMPWAAYLQSKSVDCTEKYICQAVRDAILCLVKRLGLAPARIRRQPLI
jgi:hypothetical protein